MSFFAFSTFASSEAVCVNDNDCEELTALPAEFNNPDVSSDQIDNAYVMADKVLSDIGRSIAGDFEQEEE